MFQKENVLYFLKYFPSLTEGQMLDRLKCLEAYREERAAFLSQFETNRALRKEEREQQKKDGKNKNKAPARRTQRA